MALADLEGSATLVAVMVTDCAVLITEGAVYNPFDKLPSEGVMDQVTEVLELPVTVAVNCLLCDGVQSRTCRAHADADATCNRRELNRGASGFGGIRDAGSGDGDRLRGVDHGRRRVQSVRQTPERRSHGPGYGSIGVAGYRRCELLAL